MSNQGAILFSKLTSDSPKANDPDALGATSSRRLEADDRRLADPGSHPILIGAEVKYGLTLAVAVPGKDNAAPLIAKRVADRRDSLGSQTAL